MRLIISMLMMVCIKLSWAMSHQSVALVDAGSSGSRLHIFSYQLDKTHTPYNITEIWSKSIRPGLSTLPLSSITINNYLADLLADAPVDNMPVYLYATAGMRLLPHAKQQAYFDAVRHWFKNQPKWRLMAAQTISGQDEGLYGWLSVNYQTGALMDEAQPSAGVLDMGGASVEVTFPVGTDTVAFRPHDIKRIRLYGRTHTLFTHSFLGLGQNEVAHQFLETAPCFNQDYTLPSGEQAHANVSLCKTQVMSLINHVHQVDKSVKSVLSKTQVKQWYALGGVVDLVKSPAFNFASLNFSNQELLTKAQHSVCQKSWVQISQNYGKDDYAYGYCLFAAYYYGLMVEGYGLKPEQPLQYLAANQTADWSLGFVLHPQSFE